MMELIKRGSLGDKFCLLVEMVKLYRRDVKSDVNGNIEEGRPQTR